MPAPLAICPKCRATDGDYICRWFSCTACGYEVNVAEHQAEWRRQTQNFILLHPALAGGTSEPELRRIARHLLRCGVQPSIAWTCIASINEQVAAPPMAVAALRELMDDEAAKLLRKAAA